MSVWQQLDQMKAKYKQDRENVENAAKAYGFVHIDALPHGEWTCRSKANALHKASLRAASAGELCKQMQEAFKVAEAKAEAAKKSKAAGA